MLNRTRAEEHAVWGLSRDETDLAGVPGWPFKRSRCERYRRDEVTGRAPPCQRRASGAPFGARHDG